MKLRKRLIAGIMTIILGVSLLQDLSLNVYAEGSDQEKEKVLEITENEKTESETLDLEREDNENEEQESLEENGGESAIVEDTGVENESEDETDDSKQGEGSVWIEKAEVGIESETEKLDTVSKNDLQEQNDLHIMEMPANVIASGEYENITWVIDEAGKLTVDGEGEFTSYTLAINRAPWYAERHYIKSAEINVENMTDASFMFYDCDKLSAIDVSRFNTSQVTDMRSMFDGCDSLEQLDLKNFNTSNVTNMFDVFRGCKSLISLDISNFDTSQVTRMADMFYNCESLDHLDVSSFDTRQVTRMDGMFANCKSLDILDVSNFDTCQATNMECMFAGCESLTNLDVSNFNTSQVTNMRGMFDQCIGLTNLNLENFDTSQVTDMSYMFKQCMGLTNLNLSGFDTGRVTHMEYMFEWCENLISLDIGNFNTSQVEDMEWMFCYCENLISLDLSNFDMSNATSMGDMLSLCDNLSYIQTPKNCKDVVKLPGWDVIWHDKSGKEYTELPINLAYSITLYKKSNSGSGDTGKQAVYISGINIWDKIYDGNPSPYIGIAVLKDALGKQIPGVSLTHSYSGILVDGSTYTDTKNAPSKAGSYTLSFQMTGTNADQYTLKQSSFNFRIICKEITITAGTVEIDVNGQLPELSELKYTVDGLIASDELIKEPLLKYSADNISTAKGGKYDIIPYGADGGNNYNIKYVNGKLIVGDYGNISAEDIPEDGVIPNGLWIVGLSESGYEYTGKTIKPVVRVYDHKTLLTEKKDYTISYTRNTKAYGYASGDQGFDAKKAPTITVTAKGNYSGKETIAFKILPPDIGSDAFAADDMTIVCKAKGTQKPAPILMWNDKKLNSRTDYTVTYYDSSDNKLDSVKEAGVYYVEMAGKGNFDGTRRVKLTVTDKLKLMSKMSVAGIKGQPYTGSAIMPALTVKDGKTTLTEGTHYTVSYSRNIAVGMAYAIVTGIEEAGYSGTKRISFKITGTPIAKAAVTGLSRQKFIYEGIDITPSIQLSIKTNANEPEKPLMTGTDYTVTWQKNRNAGTATVIFTGKGGYTGTLKKTFKIEKFDIATNPDSRFIVELEQETVPYAKGGAKPKVVVKFKKSDGSLQTLSEGQDYTLSCRNHTAVNDCNRTDKQPTVTVKGKGNFSGTFGKAFSYKIAAQDIGQLTLTAQDRAYQNKKNIYATKVTVTDLNGKALKEGTDYNKSFTYTYKNETVVMSAANYETAVRAEGNLVDKNDIIPAGTVLAVRIDAKDSGNYTGTLTGEYRITQAVIFSASVSIPKQTYTGQEITLDKSQITVKIKGNSVDQSQYEIVPGSYKNNVKKGTASVTIRGVDNYGGTKTVKFSIGAKGFLWWWK